MVSADHITVWLNQVKDGDREAVRQLLEHYFQRLVQLASARLRGRPQLAAYDEDVALSAFKSLCLGAEQGRFARLDNRDDLWRLLAVLTVRKAIDLTRRAQHRAPLAEAEISEVLCAEPTPAMTAEIAEEIDRLLQRLGDADLQQIALWKVQGYTHEEIATQLGCVVRTVERKLHRIKLIWEDELR